MSSKHINYNNKQGLSGMLSYLSLSKPNTKNPKNSMPLQALNSGNPNTDKRAYLKASLTIEAALGLPLILFSMIILMFPLRIMDADRKMQMAAESVAIDVSKYMFTVNEIKEDQSQKKTDAESEDTKVDENIYEYMSIGTDAALGAFAARRAEDEVDDAGMKIVNFLGSEMMRENDMIVVKLDYEYELPFRVLRLGSLTQEAVASRRAWTGKKGSSSGSGENTGDEEDEIVYIGKNSTRYHLSPSCHYLSNSWSETVVGDDGRASGLKPCDRCGSGAKPGQVVYITPQGDKFHTDTGCSAMQAYPQAVKKSEVEWMGCCSYCGGK
ncbi:MAG: hypothetical protein Q4E54_02925 [Lachnospiraceae bacterium]|nr:hypothetical protein [Lachnospiraceae bacterium]